MTTRTQVAHKLAQGLTSDRSKAIQETAAWLVANGKTRQAAYLAKDVAWMLEEQGYVYARVTSAEALSAATQKKISDYIKEVSSAREVELELVIDPAVIGGVKIETPSATFDETVRNNLETLVREVEK